MSADWPKVELSDITTEITVGFVGSMTHEYVERGVPFFRSKNIDAYEIDWNDIRYVSEKFHKKISKSTLRAGDVAIVRTGKPGTTCVIHESVEEANCSDLVIVRVDDKKLSAHYLSYFMNSVASHQVNSRLVGAVQQHFNVGSAKKILIPLPSRKEQERIVDILKSLDDKIRVNRQINQTLEQIAQTIFKSWFVNFEPVKAKIEAKAAGRDPERAAMCAISGKLEPELDQLSPEQYQQLAATAALFPDELEESELGLIPVGWEVGTLADLCVLNAKSWGSKTIPAQVHYVDLANTKNGEISDVQIFSVEDAPSRARRVLRSGDTIVGTVRPGNRSFALIGTSSPVLTGSTGFAVLTPRAEKLRELVFMLATDDLNIDRLTRLADGAAYPAVRSEVVVDQQCIIPPDELSEKFHQDTGPMFDQILASREAFGVLTNLRDTLLPKLLSGELRPPSVPPTTQGGSTTLDPPYEIGGKASATSRGVSSQRGSSTAVGSL